MADGLKRVYKEPLTLLACLGIFRFSANVKHLLRQGGCFPNPSFTISAWLPVHMKVVTTLKYVSHSMYATASISIKKSSRTRIA